MDYEQILTNYIGHPAYLNLPDEDKQPALEVFAQRYVEQNPDQDSNFINRVTENYNKKHLRETGQGRAIPMMDRVQLPHWDEERWANLSQSQKREEIESFQAKIPELVDKYPTMREDAEHFFKQYSQGLVRENETQDQSRVADHFNRALFHGFAGGLLNYIGMPDASESVKNTFLTRPDLDDSWTGAFAQGVGDLGASMTIFLGATLIAGKAGAGASLAAMAGTGASLGTNSVMRYNQAYRNAIEAGLSEDQANESGISAIPAAAIDVVGDRILGLKILPVNSSKVFSVGTSAEKRAAIGQLIKENSTRSKLMGVAQASLSEGITEVASDYYAARAPYLLHEQNKDFLPTGDDLFKSFVIGSVLGGTLAGGAMAGRYTGDKTGTDETKYANKDIRNLAEIDRNFDSIESNREVWDAMAEGQWSKAYDISKKIIEDNLEREKAEAEQREAERTQQLDQFGTTIPGELNINLENEATQPTATYQQKKTAVATFEFAPVINDPVKQQIYTDLFESNLDATGTLESNQVARRERTMRLNQVAPDRVRFQSELTTSIKPTGINQNQVPSVMAYTDTLAAKWLSQDSTRDINQFYEKLNIKSQESMRGFNAVIDRYKQDGKAVVGVTPKSNFASFMGDMLASFRKADLLQDILTPGELQQIKDSLGVTELDDSSDKELSTQFINWLDNTYTGPAMTGAFAKIKEWVADIYKSVQMWLPRNTGMDSVFESLFQVTLSPGEFNRTVGQQLSVTPEQTTKQGTLRDIQNQQAPVTPPTKTQADQVVASQEQSVAKTRSQRARDKFAKATGVTQQETTTPLEVGDVIPEVKQSPKTFLKGKKWALQVLADLENNAPDTQVVVGNYSFEGKYHNGVIYLDKTSIVEDAELERVFKHEAAHALTVGYLNNLTQNLQGEALVKKLKDLQKDTNVSPEARALIKAYFHAGKKLNIKVAQRFNPDKKEGLTRNDYAFINLDEFIAEALSNSDFQEQLSSIKYNGKSVFDHILDLIKSLASWAEGYTTAELFGKYDGQNVLAEVMLAAHQMMSGQAGPFTPPFSPKFSPKDLLKATDDKNPASVMQKFVDVFQSKIKQTDRTLDDANKIADRFLLDVEANMEGKLGGFDREFYLGSFVTNAVRSLLTKNTITENTRGATWATIENAFLESNNHKEFSNILLSKIDGLKESNMQEIYFHEGDYLYAKYRVANSSISYVKAPTKNTLSLDTYLNVTYVNQEGNRVRELYDPSNPIHALHASDLTKAIYSMSDSQRADRLNDLAKEVAKKRHGAIHGLIRYLGGNNDYTPIEKAIVLAGALKYSYTTNGDKVNLVEMTESNELLPAITGGNSAALAQAIKEESSLKKAFKKAVENNIKFQQEQNSSKDGWIRHEQSDSMKDAIALMDDCAGTPWCTGRAETTAHDQLKLGNFDTLFVDGKPQVAIRTHNGKIEEVRGTMPDQSLTPEQEQWAKQRIETADYTGGEAFLSDMQLKQDLIDIIQNKDVEKLLILAIKDGISINNLRPKKRFRGAIGYRNKGEFEESVYNALELIKNDAASKPYESDLVYYTPGDHKGTHPEKINKKYILIGNGQYPDGMELNGEYVDAYIGRRAKKENESRTNWPLNPIGTVKITATNLRLASSEVNYEINADNVTNLHLMGGNTGFINAKKIYNYASLELGELKVKAESITADSIEGGNIEVNLLNIKKDIINSNITMVGDVKTITFTKKVKIENTNIKSGEGIDSFDIDASNAAELYFKSSTIDPIRTIQANRIYINETKLEGDVIDAVEIEVKEDASIDFKEVETSKITCNGKKLNVVAKKKYSQYGAPRLLNVYSSNIEVLKTDAVSIDFYESQIDELQLTSELSEVVVSISPRSKIKKIIFDGHVTLRDEDNDIISTQRAIDLGLVESVDSKQSDRYNVDETPDANGGFLSPKIKTESAIRRERLAQIVETLPDTSILTELDIPTFMSLAGDSPTSPRIDREAKLNIKFGDVPSLNLSDNQVTSSENAIIAQQMQENGYDRVPVIINSDIVWADQRDPASENYIEEWPVFIIKQDGEQVVNPFNRNQLNFEQYYPKVSEQDIKAFHKAYQEADETTARELLNKVAEARGFDTTLYYRADVEPVTEVNRPLYLVPSQDVAMTMAEFYAKTRDRDLDSFVYPYYVKRDLNIAQEGDTIKGRILSTSSYMFGEHHSRGSQNFTAYDLKVNGFDGAVGLIDGTSAQELVILNPADAKSAATFTFKNGSLIPLNERFSDAADVRYSPKAAFFKDNAAALQKFKQIRKGKLHDQRDNSTRGIKQAMRKIKDSDLMKLTEAELSSFFNIVNNVYNSRMKGIKNPMSRADSDKVIEKLNLFNEMLNDIAIEEMINDFSGILDFSSLDLDTITREELQAFINAATQEEQAIAAANKNDASKKAHKKREDRYRAKYTANISEMNSRYENAQDYVQQMEQAHDTPIIDEKIRLALMLHFDHLMQVDPELLTGNDLYNHFFALNNLLDGNITYVPETTIKAIAVSKDTMENLSTYISTFRDPYWKKYKFLEAVDRLNEKAELKQVRLGRITATEKTRDFLLNDLFGGLTEGILANAASRKKLKMDKYRNLILSLKKTAGRYMNAEDRFLIASFSRLIQHRYDEAGDSALARNIAKELESIQNVIDKKEREGSHFESTFAPLFRKAIEGIEGEGSFDLLMKELPQRLSGSENIKIGQARADFIQGMIDIFSDFSLESKIISEGFHGVPFTAYANYSPAPVQLNKFESRDSQSDIDKVLTDVLENMEHHHNKEGLKTKSGHFFEREKRLGPDKHYSYNPDFVVDRQLDMFTVDAATIFERFLIAERLKKGSALSEVIAVEEDGSYHADRVNHLLNIAVEYVSHATSRSEPKNLLVNILRKFVNAYSRVTLSSIHHIVSQPLAGMMDYAVRNGDINGWFKAASYYAGNRAKVEEWLDKNVASLGQRGALEAMALDYKRLPQPELNIKSDAVMRKAEEIYEGAGDIINAFIREGDKFGSRAVVLAHYLRILQKKNPNIKSLNDVDWDNADRKAFVQAIQMGEKNINASNKINRGEFFTDRNPSYSVLRNVFMAFAAHPASLATQMNMAWRDLIDLKSEGAPKEELTSKLRTIAAISTQAISFAISRFYIGSLVTKAMVSMLQDIFDDEEGKLAELEENVRLARLEGDHTLVAAAQEELNLAKNARSVLLKMENQYKAGQGGLKQSVIRDMLGSLYFGLNSPTVLRMEPITTFYDKVGEKWHKEAREERIADYELEISKASEDERYHDVARLKEELYNFQQYQNIPIMFENIGGVEIGGSYGGALSIAQKATADMIDASLGLKEWNWNDWVIYGAVTGIGQSELRKILTNVDRIENANYQTMQDSEGKMEAAELKQKEKEEREYERFMQRMLR